MNLKFVRSSARKRGHWFISSPISADIVIGSLTDRVDNRSQWRTCMHSLCSSKSQVSLHYVCSYFHCFEWMVFMETTGRAQSIKFHKEFCITRGVSGVGTIGMQTIILLSESQMPYRLHFPYPSLDMHPTIIFSPLSCTQSTLISTCDLSVVCEVARIAAFCGAFLIVNYSIIEFIRDKIWKHYFQLKHSGDMLTLVY